MNNAGKNITCLSDANHKIHTPTLFLTLTFTITVSACQAGISDIFRYITQGEIGRCSLVK